MEKKTLVVVDNAGDEHEYIDDDETEYWYHYGRDEENNATHDHELRVYRNAGIGKGGPVQVAAFFHPRYVKEFWD